MNCSCHNFLHFLIHVIKSFFATSRSRLFLNLCCLCFCLFSFSKRSSERSDSSFFGRLGFKPISRTCFAKNGSRLSVTGRRKRKRKAFLLTRLHQKSNSLFINGSKNLKVFRKEQMERNAKSPTTSFCLFDVTMTKKEKKLLYFNLFFFNFGWLELFNCDAFGGSVIELERVEKNQEIGLIVKKV